ncbi:choice-of-anchor L domain-containing protein [Lacinutrix jangbogonensis]|uniref:choice-of-anchor L domain-containing protein n=1 Tax=Lacinutrix jangbogonensis TaxID=1469557 RepID=UPI00068BAC47|nr:choice-of-anchor L domain-containing protein [Lacinutrix jangbogonensis]
MKNFTLVLFLIFSSTFLFAQDVLMQNGTVNQCSGTLFDSGGTSNYSSDENFVLTICPDAPDQFIQLDFTQFSTQGPVGGVVGDVLTIYDGDDITGAVIGSYSGAGASNNPQTITASPTSTTGCITLQFVSNSSGNTTGWVANILCLQSCQTITPTIDTTDPVADVGGIVQIPAGGSVDFTGSATFSEDGTGATSSWNFGDGGTAAGAAVSHQFNTIGTFTTTYTVTDTNPTGCSESVTITVEVLSPYITVDTTLTDQQLVVDVLIDSACAQVSNITSSTGSDFGSVNGIGSFTAIPGAFGFEGGIILSSGSAVASEGPESGTQSEGNGAWPGDADLEAQIGGTNTNNASYLQFDFVPIANTISFDFIFASEEYGTFQCGYTDAFAFLLTDQVTGVTTNLALVPGTTDIVTVFTVRDNMWNGGCPSANPAFFDAYYGTGGLPETNNPTNFLGYTVPMTASSIVTPNNTYTIKLVIADALDNAFDAAVFLGAGSFDLGGDLGDDITINAGTSECQGTAVTLDTSLDTATHTWYFEGNEITGETGSTIDVTQEGNYSVDIVFSASCQTSDAIYIEFIPGPTVQAINDLTECNDGSGAVIFDITENEAIAIGTQDPASVVVTFHNSQADADADIIPIPNPTNYGGTDGETIFIRVDDAESGMCFSTDTFQLLYLNIVLNSALSMEVCDDTTNNGTESFDLTLQDATILGTQTAADFNVTYYLDFTNADAGTNALTNTFINTLNPQPIFVRIESIQNPACYISSPTAVFDLIVNPRATAIQPLNIEDCDASSNSGISVFDLRAQESVILGTQDPLNFIVSFYESQSDAEAPVNVIPNPMTYSNTSVIQTIHVRVVDILNPTCYGYTTFDLVVNSLPVLVIPTPLEVCDDGTPDGMTLIDLTLKNNEISGGNPAYSVTYYIDQANADAETNALPNLYTNTTADMQTIFVRVEDVTTGCFDTTTLDLLVEQAPIAFTPTPLVDCDPDSDGFGVFTLSDTTLEITGGAAGLTVTYHETMADAGNNVNALTSPYNNIVVDTQIIYVRVESSTIATDCATFVALVLTVNPTPQITTAANLTPLEVCDNDADGFAVFNLSI